MPGCTPVAEVVQATNLPHCQWPTDWVIALMAALKSPFNMFMHEVRLITHYLDPTVMHEAVPDTLSHAVSCLCL